MNKTEEKHKIIKGWGIDADPKNEPTYPMKDYTGDDHKRLNYERPPLQPKTIEVLHSNERPSVSAVFGTSVPLSALSGMIRRFAFRYSESSFGHWVPLIFADRINVVEGIIHDLVRGKIPNILVERGLKAMWKYNRGVLIATAAANIVVAVAVFAWMMSKSAKKKKKRR
ncbi:MAG TPA: hypothetical protein VHO68_04345 [Bacteroidales bacterium]|nr:hypothetical protein [Bacteroidales bacterium]